MTTPQELIAAKRAKNLLALAAEKASIAAGDLATAKGYPVTDDTLDQIELLIWADLKAQDDARDEGWIE